MVKPRTLAALAVVLIFAAAILLIAAARSGRTYTVKAVFANVNGLVDTGHVEVAGFTVGTITHIGVRMGGDPEVTMQISDVYRLRRGAHAVIELGSLAGQLNRYIALSGGTGSYLPSGSTIPIEDTDEPVEIDQFLSALTPKVRTQLRTLLRDAVGTLKGRGPALGQALRYSTQAFDQTADLVNDVTADGPALRTLVARAAAGARALAGEPRDVEDTVAQLDTLLSAAAERQHQLTQSLQRLPAAAESVRADLETLHAATPTFERLFTAANPALAAIEPFARALDAAAPDATPVLQSAQALVDAFRARSPAIARLLGGKLPETLDNLERGVVGINPFFDQLRAKAPDALGWIPLLGDASANYNANGHGWLVVFYPRSAPQTPVSYGSCAPGWLDPPFDRVPGQLACDPWTSYAKSFVGGGQPDTSYLTPSEQAPYPGEFK